MTSTRQAPSPSRRDLLAKVMTVVASAVAWRATTRAQATTPIQVYKDPGCECCEKWVAHMKTNGFSATVTNTTDVNAIKHKHGIPEKLWSCHTALVSGYVIEGHVPAADIRKLLAQHPKAVVGLAIPGMPSSAPGMDQRPFQPYTVLTLDTQGRTSVFTEHPIG
jgi:hypothetical protein